MKSFKSPRWIVDQGRAAILASAIMMFSVLRGLSADGWLEPVDPMRLLILLEETQPKIIKDEGWKMMESRAFHDPEGEWMLSIARRKFEKTLDEANPETGPAKLQLELTDSALYPARIAAYSTPDVENPLVNQKIGSFPAILFPESKGNRRIIIFIHERFLLSISTTGFSEVQFAQLLSGFSFESMANVEKCVVTALPSPFARKMINEIEQTEDSRPTQVLKSADRQRAESDFQETLNRGNTNPPDQPDDQR